ncbi:MAG: serine hydrolase [Cyclobacteriaceae bacterium]|nr:serine hydrolase [Cyclobacteriaceae bacterium]
MAFSAIIGGLNGRYFKQNEIKEKVNRVLMLKYHAGLGSANILPASALALGVEKPSLDALSYQVYTKAMKKTETGAASMPFIDLTDTHFASLSLGFSDIKTFQETLDKYAPFVHYMLPGNAYDPYDLGVLQNQLAQFDHVIVGLHTSGLIELDGALLRFLNHLNAHTNVILVFLGKAIEPVAFSAFSNKIFAHEDNHITQQIAAQYVFGALPFNAAIQRLAYSTPEMQGMDSRTLAKIDSIAHEAIRLGATPGCQVLVARNGAIVLEKGYGYYTYDSIMPVDTRTIYDLASVTKTAATTQAIMKLVEEGKIELGDSLGQYLHELSGSNKGELVIREVLAHQSGLRAFYPFWKNTIEDEKHVLHYYKDNPTGSHSNEVAYGMFAGEDLKDSLWQWTINTRLRTKRYSYKPYDYKYSDLGFYMMQVLAERASGRPLDVYVDSVFYKPMGMSTLSFNPLCKFPMMRIAPTERDTEFRHVLIWGTVHDQIAAMKGGVSGHAGLFGNANDLAKIMQMQLQEGFYGGRQYLKGETIRNFTAQQYADNRRGLGWDKPDEQDVKENKFPTLDSFGHTGFTGTIVWADPTFNLVYVFLSNRIYPSIDNGKLSDLRIRKRIQNVVYESILDFDKHYH